MEKIEENNITTFFVKGAEWFARLAVLNLCWILFSLPVLTVIPATDTVFELLNQWSLNEVPQTSTIFKQFKHYFFLNFKKSYSWGIPLLFVSAILFIDLYILNQLTMSSAGFQVIKYAFYTFSFLLVLSILYGVPMMKRMDNYHIKIFVYALIMGVLNPITTLVVCLSIIGLVVIFLIWPSMLFFFALTGIAWVMTKAVRFIFSKELAKNEV